MIGVWIRRWRFRNWEHMENFAAVRHKRTGQVLSYYEFFNSFMCRWGFR